MAKPTTYATPLCLIFSVVALVGIYFGFRVDRPLVIALALLPAIIYEVYRTEGRSTKTSSWLMLAIIVLESYFLYTGKSYNIAGWLGREEAYIGGYSVPLGDIKIVAPAVMAILAIILFIRTSGIYTKWLAVIIFVAAFALIYKISPEGFSNLWRSGADSVI